MRFEDNIPYFNDIELSPMLEDRANIDLLLKNHLLFAEIENKPYAILHKEYLVDGLNYLSKLNMSVDIAFIDEDSYEKLYSRYLELKSDKELQKGFSDNDKEEFLEDDISLANFLKTSSDILTGEESAPVIKFVNSLFYQAIKQNASDIHIETHEYKGLIRFRIDGVLIDHVDLDNSIIRLVINRIKVISNLDISEKRIPQDGRTSIKISQKKLDIRVSILPTYYGERVVMRILMDSTHIPALEDLGFDDELIKSFRSLLSYSYGMILVTGPTGSGKSTTLHSFLKTVSSSEKNIITIEDPVEYKANNINQIQVNAKTGLTFATGLRSILRQDPDIVMVGEIRDSETAKIAIQAALTGHLILSTLHTNNTTATITRLLDMGIEEFLISSSLIGILSQRLVRKLCNHCKEPDYVDIRYKDELQLDKASQIYKAKGCNICNFTGYKGRMAVGEFMFFNDEIKAMLKKDMKDYEIRDVMSRNGMVLLEEKLKKVVENGTTSIKEALRVGMR